MKPSKRTRFCAFCRSERLVYLKRRSSLVDAAASAVASGALSFILWQDLDPRAIGFFVVGLGFCEVFVGLRFRLSLPCPHCGFDVVLYKKSPSAAAERVKARLADRRLDPATWLATKPKLPVIIKRRAPRPRNLA